MSAMHGLIINTIWRTQKRLITFIGCHLTLWALGWDSPLLSQSFCSIFSLPVDCQDNKYLNRNDLNFEGTFHLAGERVIHIEEWQHVRPAKLIPKVAQNDTAYSQRCLRHMCVCQVFWMSLQILYTSGAGDVLFLSQSDYIHPFFFFFTGLWESMFWLSVRKITQQGFLENTFSLCPNTDAMCAGEQQHCWTTWRLSLLTFYNKSGRCHL